MAVERRALVMLVELSDGTIALIDASEQKHEAKDAEQLWAHARSVLGDGTMPALSAAPAPGKSEDEKLQEAFGTLGDKLRQAAEAEYGAPVVDAAATVVGRATKKATGFLQRVSRRGGRGRARLRRKTAG